MFKSTSSDQDYFPPRRPSKSGSAPEQSSLNITYIGSDVYKQGFLELRLMTATKGSGSASRRRGSVWSGYKTFWCVLTEKGIYVYDDPLREKCRCTFEFDDEAFTISDEILDTSLSTTSAAGAFVIVSEIGATQIKTVDSAVKTQWLQAIEDARAKKSGWNIQSTVEVELLEAKELDSKDMNGKSDPFCYVVVEHNCRQSSIKYKTLNPVYNERFTFEVMRFPVDINIVMYDYDRLSASDFMGITTVTLRGGTPKNDYNEWLTLRPRREGRTVNGKLKVRIAARFAESELAKLTLGISLGSYMSRPQNINKVVPDIAFHSIRSLNSALDVEGLFRVPGNNTLIKELEMKLDKNEPIDFNAMEAHDVASFVKAYMRDLPEPLVGANYYNQMVIIGKLSDPQQIRERLRAVIQSKIESIREAHRSGSANTPAQILVSRSFFFLCAMTHLLKKIAMNSAVNKMHPANLAVVFGPVFCGNPIDTSADLAANAIAMAQMPAISAAAQNMIDYFYDVFDFPEHEDVVQDLLDSANNITHCRFVQKIING